MKDLVSVGAKAPDWTLAAGDGRTYALKDVLTRHLALLVFYPGNNTPGCDRQLSAVRDDIEQFRKAGVQPFGVNPAAVDSHRKYAEKMKFNFPLLSDPGRTVAAAFGAIKPDGQGIQRSVVLVGKDGKVLFAARGAPGAGEVLEALGSPK